MKTFFVVFLVVFIPHAIAEDKAPLSEQLKRLDQSRKEAETWAAKEQSIARQRENDCFNAFGHKPFCTCLNKELHWILTFDSYVRIATATSDQLLSALGDERAVIDSAVRAREVCVRRTITPR